ncbi:copper chaperone PCu(A)C [Sphingomonas sp. MG17]|uniref:Copper chaperone PCu(A)C n=1 Tax=Sphingomonas tagetis TaxID=2949092 RepID=A0A9X2HHC3_9SPHN|nr:copper chaperone PCu(A)C [Sphingomonas tagetis]MCP3728841.1 copper chaperone PCu(A)C [Sphingomonas tagetis]
MRRVFAAMLIAATMTACQQAEPVASDAWVRLPAVTGRPGAAYLKIRGGAEATTLLSVSTPAAIRTEIHEMKQEGGMMTMAPLKDVAIPSRADVELKPGGKHVMLYDIAPTLRAGATIPLKLSFADGKTIEVTAQVKAAGAD